jgi:hypothetical protein
VAGGKLLSSPYASQWVHNSLTKSRDSRDDFWNSSWLQDDPDQEPSNRNLHDEKSGRFDKFSAMRTEMQEKIQRSNLNKYGVKINARGHVIVESREKAQLPQAAVLLVKPAPTSLWFCDFYRLAKPTLGGEANLGGLINVM